MGRSLVFSLIVGFLVLSGCGGGGEEKPEGAVAPKPAGTAVEAAKPGSQQQPPATEEAGEEEDEYEYELDVFVDADPDEGPPPLRVHFTADVEEEEGGPFRFAWDFGDGAKSTEKDPTHTYKKVGDYTATLTVTNAKGEKGTDEIDIFVEEEDE